MYHLIEYYIYIYHTNHMYWYVLTLIWPGMSLILRELPKKKKNAASDFYRAAGRGFTSSWRCTLRIHGSWETCDDRGATLRREKSSPETSHSFSMDKHWYSWHKYHLSMVNGYIGSIYIYMYLLRIVNISGYQWYTTHFRIEISERPTIFLWNGLYTIWECGPDGSSWQVAIWSRWCPENWWISHQLFFFWGFHQCSTIHKPLGSPPLPLKCDAAPWDKARRCTKSATQPVANETEDEKATS